MKKAGKVFEIDKEKQVSKSHKQISGNASIIKNNSNLVLSPNALKAASIIKNLLSYICTSMQLYYNINSILNNFVLLLIYEILCLIVQHLYSKKPNKTTYKLIMHYTLTQRTI